MCLAATAAQLGRYDKATLAEALEYWRRGASIGAFIQRDVCIFVPADVTREFYGRFVEVRDCIDRVL